MQSIYIIKRRNINNMRCPKCGNESDGKFCGICGAKLEDNTVQSNNNEVYEFNFNENQSQQAEQQAQFNVNQQQQVEQQAQFNANQVAEQQPQFNVNQTQQVKQPQFDSNNIAFTSGEHFEGKGFNINEKINKINQNTTQLNSEDIKFTSGDFINQNNNVNNGAPVFGSQNSNANNGAPVFGSQNSNANNGTQVFGNQNGNVNNGAPVFGSQNSNANNGAQVFGGQNNYNNNANVQSNNVKSNSITKRISKDNLKKPAFLLGTIGSIVLIISVFLTYVSISMSMFGNTKLQGVKLIDCEDGKFFLILAIISLVFSVLYLGIPTLVTAGIEFILGIYEVANSSKILGDEVNEYLGDYLSSYIDVNFGPGAILLIIGSIAVLIGGIMMYRETKRKFAFNINNIGQQFTDTMQDRANNLGNDYTNSFGNTSQNGNVQNNNMQSNTMNIPNGSMPNNNINIPNNNINIPNSNINMPNNNVNMNIPDGRFDVNHSVNLNKDNDSQIPPQ